MSNAYQDALKMLGLADQSALRALETSTDNPVESIAPLIGSLLHVLVAQVHATLAVADAIMERPS